MTETLEIISRRIKYLERKVATPRVSSLDKFVEDGSKGGDVTLVVGHNTRIKLKNDLLPLRDPYPGKRRQNWLRRAFSW